MVWREQGGEAGVISYEDRAICGEVYPVDRVDKVAA